MPHIRNWVWGTFRHSGGIASEGSRTNWIVVFDCLEQPVFSESEGSSHVEVDGFIEALRSVWMNDQE